MDADKPKLYIPNFCIKLVHSEFEISLGRYAAKRARKVAEEKIAAQGATSLLEDPSRDCETLCPIERPS